MFIELLKKENILDAFDEKCRKGEFGVNIDKKLLTCYNDNFNCNDCILFNKYPEKEREVCKISAISKQHHYIKDEQELIDYYLKHYPENIL